MKRIVLGLLIIGSFLFSCGPKPMPSGTDTTPPEFLITVERIDRATSRSDGNRDISKDSITLRITGNDLILIRLKVFDQESGIRSVSLVADQDLLDGRNYIKGNLKWMCTGVRNGETTGSFQAGMLSFDKPLPPAEMNATYGVDLRLDPHTTAPCINNDYSSLEGWFQVVAVNGDGLTARSGQLYFMKP